MGDKPQLPTRQMTAGTFQEVTEVAMFKLFRQSWGNKQHAEQLAEKAGIALKEIEIGDIQGNGKLDIVFSFDTTHSMTAYLNQVRDNLKDITKTLFDEIPNIRIGIIAHGDYESPRFPLKGNDKVNHYVIKHLDLTNSYEEILAFLEGCNETGGGDRQECYELAMYYANQRITWRHGSSRAFVLIGDDEPHSIDYVMNAGNIDWRYELRQLNEKLNVVCYSVQCGHQGYATYFYKAIADIAKSEDGTETLGKHLTINEFETMPTLFIGICLKEADPTGDMLMKYMHQMDGDHKLNKEKRHALQDLAGDLLKAVLEK